MSSQERARVGDPYPSVRRSTIAAAFRMWMPYDNGFLLWQPHLRNVGALAMRRNDGYGASTFARLWIDK